MPSSGQPLGIYELLVTLGMIPDRKDKVSAVEHSETGHPAQTKRRSSPATKKPSVDQALDTSAYQNLYTPKFTEHNVSSGGWSGQRDAHVDLASAQSASTTPAPTSSSAVTAWPKKSSSEASRARTLWPDTAPVEAQDLQAALSHPDGQLWRHTTDAYQEVSGPSNFRKRSLAVISSAPDSYHHEIHPQHGSILPSEQDETPPESEGDTNDHIRIAF